MAFYGILWHSMVFYGRVNSYLGLHLKTRILTDPGGRTE